MRKTKIICTIGPASESEEKLRELIDAGMNVARFNFSHGTHEEHRNKFKRLVRIRKEMGKPVATLMDTKGPEIRLRDFEGGKVVLEKGKGFTLTTEEVMGTAERATISYKNLVKDVSKGSVILIDDAKEGKPSLTHIEGYDIEHNDSDGYGLMTPQYSKEINIALNGIEDTISGFTCRYAWTKGMVYTFDYVDFAEKVAAGYQQH